MIKAEIDEHTLNTLCGECFQFDAGQTGTNLCPSCGLPTVWSEDCLPEHMLPEVYAMMQDIRRCPA